MKHTSCRTRLSLDVNLSFLACPLSVVPSLSVMPARSAEVLPRSVVNFVICGLLLLLRLHRLHLLRPRHHLLLLDAA